MNQNEIFKMLVEPFKASEIDWRLQTCIEDKMQGLAIPYIENRVIQNRLDEVLTPARWKNEYTLWQPNSQLCTILIRIEYEDGSFEWVGKSDGSGNSDIEPIKGGLSDSMKRAAVQWGIGRYLYQIGSMWINIEKRGKSFIISKSEQSRLDDFYSNEVSRITKNMQNLSYQAKHQTPGIGGNRPKQERHLNSVTSESSSQNDTLIPFPEFISDTDSSDETDSGTPLKLFMVSEVKTTSTQYGDSTNVKLVDLHDGSVIEAYVNGSSVCLVEGMKIKNVKVTLKKGKKRDYYVLDSYETAA